MLDHDGHRITAFKEKPNGEGGWVNAGFFVLSPKVGETIEGDDTIWERGPLERLAAMGQLGVHLHRGFWQPMDTLRDKMHARRAVGLGRAAVEGVDMIERAFWRDRRVLLTGHTGFKGAARYEALA